MPQHGRSLRLASVGLGLLLLLVLVSLGSRSGVTRSSDAAPTPGYVSWAMSVFLILFVCAIPWAAYLYILQAREVGTKSERKSFQARVARGLMFVGILALAMLLKVLFHGKLHFSFSGAQHLTTPPGAAGHDRRPHAVVGNPTFKWPVLYGFVVLVAAGVALWWFKLRHRTSPLDVEDDGPTFEQQIASSLDDALDDLAAEPDARRAVIAAYARMERTFAGHGLQRRASETPVEYLRRILLGLTSRSEAVARLTGLFEQAKFSSHAIDASMKADAIRALQTIRDDLQAAPA
ncbi:MAG TPA: DUF4129 domain-containing protein [Gaiellaceae bacterium]